MATGKSKRKCFADLVVVLLLIIQVSTVVRCDPEPKNGKKTKAFGRFASSVAGAALGNLLTNHIKPAEKHHHHYYGNSPTISLQPAVQSVPAMMPHYQQMAPSQPVYQVAAPMAPAVPPVYAQSVQAPMSPPAPMTPAVPAGYAQGGQAPMVSVVPAGYAQSGHESMAPPAPPGYAPSAPVYLPAAQHNVPVMTPQYQPTAPTQPIVSVVQQGYHTTGLSHHVNSVVSTVPIAPVTTSPTKQYHQMAQSQPIAPFMNPEYKHHQQPVNNVSSLYNQQYNQTTPSQPIAPVVYPVYKVNEQRQPASNMSSLYNQQQPVNNVSSLYSQRQPVAPRTAQQLPMGFVAPHLATNIPVTVQTQHATANSIHHAAIAPLAAMVPAATHPQTIVTPPVRVFAHHQVSFGQQLSAGKSQVYILSKKSGIYEKVKNGVNGFIRPSYVAVLFTVMLLAFI